MIRAFAILFLATAANAQQLLNPFMVAPSAPPADNALIVWLKFNEGTGTTLNDDSGNAFHGSMSGATWITGKSGSGGALQFDGVNDWAKTGTVTFGNNIITVCAWVYWDAFADNDDLLWEATDNYNNTAHTFIADPNFGGGGVAQVGLHGDAGVAFRHETFTRWSAATWTHVAVVYDNSTTTGEIKIYIDGTEVSGTVIRNDKTGSANFTAAVINLMCRNSANLFGAGKMDDFRVYAGELTQPEVAAVAADAQ